MNNGRILSQGYLSLTWFAIKKIIIVILPGILFFLYLWQNVEYSRLNREIRKLTVKREELIKKNDDLKIGIAEYTSAERIEELYRKTYQYLPISIGNRIITVTLPPEAKDHQEIPK